MSFDYIEKEDPDYWVEMIYNNFTNKSLGNKQISCGLENDYPNPYVDLDEIKNVLAKLKTFAHSNQEFQYVATDGKAYHLNNDGQVEESKLSDDDIIKGNFSGKDLIARFYKENGSLQVSSMGISRDVPITDKLTTKKEKHVADKESVSEDMLHATQNYLKKHRTEDFDSPMVIDNTGKFPSGSDIEVNGESSIFAVIADGGDLVVTLLKTAEIERKFYLENNPAGKSPSFSLPGEVTGFVEGGASAVTDITSLVSMCYEVVVDDDKRNEMKQGFSALANEVKKNPAQLFPLLGEMVLSGATGLESKEYAEIVADTTDAGRVGHLVVKAAVTTTVTVLGIVFTGGVSKAGKVADVSRGIANKLSRTQDLIEIFGPIGKHFRHDVKQKIFNLSEELQDKFVKDFKKKISKADADILSKNPELIDVWSNCAKTMKNADKIASVDMLECMQKHSKVSLKHLDDFITDDFKDDLHKFFKENKDEILKSEDKFKALVGDLDEIPSFVSDEMSVIKSRYSFVKDIKLKRQLVLQAAKGYARNRLGDFFKEAGIEAIKQIFSYYLLKFEKNNYCIKDESFFFLDSDFNWDDFWFDVIGAGLTSVKKLNVFEAAVFDCLFGGDITKLYVVRDIFETLYRDDVFSNMSEEQKNKIYKNLRQFGAQCLINVAFHLLPKVADDSKINYFTTHFLDFWSKYICGEIDSIIK